MNIVYVDSRFGDRYELTLSPTGEFVSAIRYIDEIGRDPILYTSLAELNPHHKFQIEQIIWKLQNKK